MCAFDLEPLVVLVQGLVYNFTKLPSGTWTWF